MKVYLIGVTRQVPKRVYIQESPSTMQQLANGVRAVFGYAPLPNTNPILPFVELAPNATIKIRIEAEVEADSDISYPKVGTKLESLVFGNTEYHGVCLTEEYAPHCYSCSVDYFKEHQDAP